MTDEREREDGSLNGLIGTIGLQLKALVEVVQELSDVQEQRAEDQATYYAVETTDPQEMQRLMKSADLLLALNEIVNGEWQRDMIKHGRADRLTEKDLGTGEDMPFTPAEAMHAYRDEIFEILQRHGIALDDLL